MDTTLILGGAVFRPDSTAGARGLLSLIGPASILSAYWMIGRSGFLRNASHVSQVCQWGWLFGIAAGIVFCFEILLEYLISPDTATNIRLGWVEFGTVFALFAICAFCTAWSTGWIAAGVRAAATSGMLSSLIWLTTLWLAIYVFWGTARQEQVFRVEGDYEDFARSGMHDFGNFTLHDLWGATFFHLLLGPLVAMILGIAAAGLAKVLRPNKRTRSAAALD